MTNPRNAQWRSRALIIVIALISIIPFGLAWYYARHPELIGKTSNYGTLILPPRQLDYAQLFARPVSPPESLSEIKGRWVLLHVAAGPCRDACAEALYKTHQVRLMLNKEIPRIRRLLLVPPGASAADSEALLKNDGDLLITGAPEPLLQILTTALGKPPGESMAMLMDPHANVILWYEAGFDPYKMLKDLKHLLKASQIG
jgi:hypothetical protein